MAPAPVADNIGPSIHDLFGVHYEGEPPLKNFWALDYRASRGNFYIHQQRSLLLAEHIVSQLSNKENPRIAVCGGGVGGLTCFLALHTLGMEDTQLFEAGKAPLDAQSRCDYRYAHPSQNDWPNGETFTATTDMPFLNWCSGSIDRVIEDMRNDPLLGKAYDCIGQDKIHTSAPIAKITEVGGNQWSMDLEPGWRGSNIQPRPFDAIVYAVGFGKEQDLEHSWLKSYWWADNLFHFRREWYEYPKHRIYISGQGDGALIDAARIGFGLEAYENPGPRLIALTREDLNPVSNLTAPDTSAEKLIAGLKSLFPIIPGEETDNLLVELRNLIQVVLDDEDHPLAQEIRDLEDRIEEFGDGLTVVSRKAFGEGLKMSPINALIFAILSNCSPGNKEFNYEEGRLHFPGAMKKGNDDGEPVTAAKDDVAEPLIRFHDERLPDVAVKDNIVIVRHGPSEKHIASHLGKGNKKRVERGSPHNNLPKKAEIARADFYRFVERKAELREGESEQINFDWQFSCVRRMITERLKQTDVMQDPQNKDGIVVKVVLLPSQDQVGQDDAKENLNSIRALGGFDQTLFGLPVRWDPVKQGESGFLASTAWTE